VRHGAGRCATAHPGQDYRRYRSPWCSPWAVPPLGAAAHPATSVSTAQTDLLSSPLTAGGRQVGHIYVATGVPSWVYMAIDTDQGSGTVTCQLQQHDGRTITLGTFDLKDGYGTWGAPSPVEPETVASARVLTVDGTVIATAAFED